MRYYKQSLFLFFLGLLCLVFFFLPVKDTLLFTGTKGKKVYYVTINEQKKFEIRYVHSIHLTDVIEYYEITPKQKIRMLSMSYKNLSIGLPGDAAEGETLELRDGVYTLTYNDRVIDSFRIHIGRVDADLALRYANHELDLKKHLEKGKSYEFKVKKLTYYQLTKGEKLNG
ncbi:DUF1850 domain-containing protein [Sporosarcina pasteurii]|uniref:Uncharacterized conserved protein n=1 Tax=Sporosarcina pasteurii TaxID=1474 RepID=A0A380BGK9_SPOPA|nr:DUF1850 domain-containing protein [Sporosarcina pasteurii]MDS9470403.1 DUF1850 domain-containing protein [Sporosarcina pasteurii]QBQ05895.1 DUF1850 domain-containing protein [Sporosarcina pasteurii]SUJ00184.1 Uncharacterized conserved protein [Sporosarcina pasteurii]